MNKLLISTVLLLVAGCNSTSVKTVPADLQLCESPRADFCTREYRPVCGYGDSLIKSYGNACSACADRNVQGYISGLCDEE